MAQCRRSSRFRKKVDYLQVDTAVVDSYGSDDDFTDPDAPPVKRAKVNDRIKKKCRDDCPGQQNMAKNERQEKKKRAPLEDKLCEKDLKTTLEISVLDSQETQLAEHKKNKQDKTHNVEDDNQTTSSVKSNLDSSDKVIVDEDERSNSQLRIKQAAGQKQKQFLTKEEEDYASEFGLAKSSCSSEEGEEFAEGDENDSNYKALSKRSKNSKSKCSRPRPEPLVKPKPRMSATVIPVIKGGKTTNSMNKGTSSKNFNNKAAASTTTTTTATVVSIPSRITLSGGLSVRKPSWLPPGQSGTSHSSPPGGADCGSPLSRLRVGLSRNQKVHSLHSTLKVHP